MQFDDTTHELISNPNYTKFSFPQSNRYRNMPVYTFNNETFFGTFKIIKIPNNPKDKYHQIKPGEEGRWDLMSFNEYQTVDYWWLICLANEIYNPMESPPAGTLIRLPASSTIFNLDALWAM